MQEEQRFEIARTRRTRRHGGWEGAQRAQRLCRVQLRKKGNHTCHVWSPMSSPISNSRKESQNPELTQVIWTKSHSISQKTPCVSIEHSNKDQPRTTWKHTSECTPNQFTTLYIFNHTCFGECLSPSLQTQYWSVKVSKYSPMRLGW